MTVASSRPLIPIQPSWPTDSRAPGEQRRDLRGINSDRFWNGASPPSTPATKPCTSRAEISRSQDWRFCFSWRCGHVGVHAEGNTARLEEQWRRGGACPLHVHVGRRRELFEELRRLQLPFMTADPAVLAPLLHR